MKRPSPDYRIGDVEPVPFVPTSPPCCGRCGCEVCGCTAERRAMRDQPITIKHVPIREVMRLNLPTPDEALRRMAEETRKCFAQQYEDHLMDAVMYGMGAVKVSKP